MALAVDCNEGQPLRLAVVAPAVEDRLGGAFGLDEHAVRRRQLVEPHQVAIGLLDLDHPLRGIVAVGIDQPRTSRTGGNERRREAKGKESCTPHRRLSFRADHPAAVGWLQDRLPFRLCKKKGLDWSPIRVRTRRRST